MQKRYVDNPKDRSKLTHLLHGDVHSSDICKVLGDLDKSIIKSGLLRTARRSPQKTRSFNKKLEDNSMIQHAVYGIILTENIKGIAEDDAQDIIDSEVD